jgi:hypothetical protein
VGIGKELKEKKEEHGSEREIHAPDRPGRELSYRDPLFCIGTL